MIETLPFLQNLAISLLLGGLIGLERERRTRRKDERDFGGIRTFSLVGIFSYLVFSFFGDNIVLFSLFTGGFLALLISSHIASSFIYKNVGATTEVAALFVYLIGMLMGMGQTLYASVIALTVMLILHFRDPLHAFARCLEKEELYDTLKFVAIIFVVLPLLPDQTYGPLDVFNPHMVWLIVVLVSSISFVSYVAIKLLGPKKGLGLGGFFGGLISSTAVSMSLSEMSKKARKAVPAPFVFGILIASSAMFFRILLEVQVLNPNLATNLYLPLLTMGLLELLFSVYYWFIQRDKKSQVLKEEDLGLSSPFQLWPALKFGLFFAALLFISKFASQYLGREGVYITAVLSGLVDVDAITVSMANLNAGGDIAASTARMAVVLAAVTNTLVKGLIPLFFASRKVGLRVFFAMVIVVLVGMLTLFI